MVEVDAPRWQPGLTWRLYLGAARIRMRKASNSTASTITLRTAVVSAGPGTLLGCLTLIHSLVGDDRWNDQGEKAWELRGAMQTWLAHRVILAKEV